MVDRTKNRVEGAVATTNGWVNPKTGELLVSIRGLSGAIAWTRKDGLEALQKAVQEPLVIRKDDPKSPEIQEALKEMEAPKEAEPEVKEEKPAKPKKNKKAK